ncbi:Uncharacterised protein [Bordetella pertussis]|nr:Uncharacterised protein [Bordetella pertussis]
MTATAASRMRAASLASPASSKAAAPASAMFGNSRSSLLRSFQMGRHWSTAMPARRRAAPALSISCSASALPMALRRNRPRASMNTRS